MIFSVTGQPTRTTPAWVLSAMALRVKGRRAWVIRAGDGRQKSGPARLSRCFILTCRDRWQYPPMPGFPGCVSFAVNSASGFMFGPSMAGTLPKDVQLSSRSTRRCGAADLLVRGGPEINTTLIVLPLGFLVRIRTAASTGPSYGPCLSGLHPHPLGLEGAQTGYRGARHGYSTAPISHSRIRYPSSSDFSPMMRPAPPTWRTRWGDGFACPHCGTAGEPFHLKTALASCAAASAARTPG